jgi:hypothetical protein
MQTGSAPSNSEDLQSSQRVHFSTADALQPPPPLEWCVERLLAQPSLTILVGDPGSKKTLTVIDLAVCVALGEPWLGHSVNQGPVLFIDEQTGPHQLLARFNAALIAHNASPEIPLHLSSLGGHNLRNKESADALVKLATSKNARLIVVDAFANLLRGGSESSLAAVLPVLFNLRRMAEYCNAAVIVTHHTNRHGFFRGSAAISAAADLMLFIESKPAEPVITISTLKARFLAPDTFSARANFGTEQGGPNRFFLNRAEEKTSTSESTTLFPPGVTGLALDVYQDISYRGQTFKELYIHHIPATEGSLRNAIQQLLNEGLIVRSDNGGKGKQAHYSIPKPP